MGVSPEMEAAVRKTVAQRDAYRFVLSCIATGDCEDPVTLAREILAEGRGINRKGRAMTTKNLTPEQTADVIGSVVKSALIQSAGALKALRTANQALYHDDPEKAALVIRNYLTMWDTDEGVLVNLDNAIYSALPRGGEPVSGY